MIISEIFGTRKFVEHKIAEVEIPPLEAIKFDYLLAGNGLFIRAKRKEFAVCLPLNQTSVKGLPVVKSEITCHEGQIPKHIWQEILLNAREGSDSIQFREDVYVVYRDEQTAQWHWKNIGTKRNYASTVADDSLAEYDQACLEIHTHPPGAVHFSQMDDADESGKFRIFGILIDIHSPNPKVRFRCGIYDHFVPVPAYLFTEISDELIDLNNLERVIIKDVN